MELLTNIRPWLLKNSNSIKVGSGMALGIISFTNAITATIKAKNKIDKVRKDENKDDLTKKETLKITWKYYIAPVVELVAAETLIFTSFNSVSKKGAALALAYESASTAFNEYRQTVKETVGEKKEKEIHEKVSQKITDSANTNKIAIPEETRTWFIDGYTHQVLNRPSSWEEIRGLMNDANQMILNNYGNRLSLAEWQDMIGIDRTQDAEYLGFDPDNKIDISLDATTKNGRVYGVIYYKNMPRLF